MKPFWLLAGFLMIVRFGQAQFASAIQSQSIIVTSESDYLRGKQDFHIAGLRSDPQLTYRFPSPWLTNWATPPGGQSYWLSTTTTQSFNHGKFGTIYYYDQLGNMRYASPFIDIAGKNKRGLKLLLPTFTQRMFMGR